jgi:hypothetical protein
MIGTDGKRAVRVQSISCRFVIGVSAGMSRVRTLFGLWQKEADIFPAFAAVSSKKLAPKPAWCRMKTS